MTRRQSYMFSLCFLLNIVLCWSCPHHEKHDGHDGHEVEGKTDSSNTVPKSDDYKVICYYGSWAVYRPGDGKFPVENIDPFLCSHLIYGFAGLSNENKIRPLDPYNDLKENYGKGAFLRFNALKSINKKLKTLIAIGGWNEGSIKYSNMASKPESRKIFVDSVVAFIEKYGFDGLDLDWEYPASRGGKPEDKQNLVSLMRELKEAFQPRGYLLTSAVSAGKWNIDPGYDIPAISQYLDIINVMAYDYHGGWENKTGHNAPLYARPDEVPNDKISNVNFSINYWISNGAPRNKIVLGMGTYGRSFTLQRAEVNGLGAPAPQTGRAGPYTREAGSLGYNEICEMKLNNKQWTEVRDPYYLAPYAFSDRQWVGFDDVESITLKTQYAKAMQLGGAMIWSVETDDFKGKCGQKYPLLNAINQVFKSDSVVMPLPTPSDQDISTPVTKPWVSISSTPKTPTKPTPSTSKPTPSTSKPTPSTSSTWWPQPSPSSSPSTWWPQPSPSSSPSTWWPQPSPSSSPSTWWPRPSSASTEQRKPSSSSTPSSVGSSVAQSSSTTGWPWAQTHSSPQSSSSTTTSTAKPGVPDHEVEGDSNKTFHCHDSGIYKHEKDCTKFYRCVPTNAAGVYNPVVHDCPGTTVFNPKTSLCDWVENVPECRNKVPNNFFRFHKSFGK